MTSESDMSLGARLRSSLGTVRRFATWAWHDLRASPALALYARRQSRINQRFFAQIQARDKTGASSYLSAFEPGSMIPKILWMYWAQGEAGAPFVVQRCIASWRDLNPDWEVRILDDATLSSWSDLSDVPAFLPRRYMADMLRLRLLKQHGGVWADATVLCHRPLDDWLPLHTLAGFFVFSDPGPDRWLTSWFMAATPDHPLTTAWEEAYAGLVISLRHKPAPYFILHYSFQNRARHDADLLADWKRCACLPAMPTFLLMAALEDKLPLPAATEAIARGLPVSKLSWKSKVAPAHADAVLNDLAQ